MLARQVQREYDQLSRLRIKRQLLDALAERADFPVPQTMVEAEFAQIWQRIEADRKQGAADADDAGKDDETLRREYRAIAERRVRLGLLLAEIGGPTASPSATTNSPVRCGRRPAATRVRNSRCWISSARTPRRFEGLRGPIFEEKVVDFVLELAQVTEQTVTPEELAAEAEAVSADGMPPASTPPPSRTRATKPDRWRGWPTEPGSAKLSLQLPHRR